MERVNYIPEGFHTATPFLCVKDGNRAMEFYTKAFGAKVIDRHDTPDGRLMHAEFKVGDSPFMLGEHQEVAAAPAAGTLPMVSVYLYVEDADAVAGSAVRAGAKELYPVSDKFYGNREGGITDPFGIVWWIATRKEILTPAEMQKRAAAAGRG